MVLKGMDRVLVVWERIEAGMEMMGVEEALCCQA